MEAEAVQELKGKTTQRGLFSPQDRKKPAIRLGLLLGGFLLLAGGLLTVAPILWMILGSFKTSAEIYSVPQTYWPGDFQFQNYLEALRLIPFDRYFLNSLLMALGIMAGQLFVCSLAAYSLSKLRVRFGKAILLMFMTSLMVPFEVQVIPLYLILKFFPPIPGVQHFNLINSYWGLILPGIFSAFSIVVLKEFFDSIPKEIIYAARIDGCGEIRIFLRFILPMARPILSILAIFSFVTSWNSFFWPLIVLNNPDYYPLTLGVQKLVQTGEPWNVVMAALVLSAIPSVILFLLFQRTIIRGVASTGIYG